MLTPPVKKHTPMHHQKVLMLWTKIFSICFQGAPKQHAPKWRKPMELSTLPEDIAQHTKHNQKYIIKRAVAEADL